jgi:hypothetical protein
MQGDREAAMRVVAGRALLSRVARALAGEDVVPLVLKGVLLSALTEGARAPARTMVDVDVLVRPRERERSVRALAAIGLTTFARTRVSTSMHDARTKLELDLHAHLCEPELFRLDTDAIVDRSIEDTALFGFRVRVPERHDLYAHLVAHFVRNRSNARDVRRLNDLAVVARALPMEPRELASHLARSGLGRAARYVLALAARQGDRFAAAVLRELPRDATGVLLARAARPWLKRFSEESPLAIPALHALNSSLPAGARSFGLHALHALERYRETRRSEGTPLTSP